MTRRAVLAIAVVAALAVGACSSPSSTTAGVAVETTTTAAPATTTTGATITSTTVAAAAVEGSTTTRLQPLVTTVETESEVCRRVEDFGDDAADRWIVVNDGVMGGLSNGTLTFSGGTATFAGDINTDGGGFSMIRTSALRSGDALGDALDGVDFLRVRMRSSEPRDYELTMEDRASSGSSLMFFTNIDPVGVDWVETDIPLTALDGRFFGNAAPDVQSFSLEETVSVGIILADGIDGEFSLELDRIDACSTLP